jgi:hypothetical protein
LGAEGRQDDIVWRVRRGDEVACVYLLLEFQSSADARMALRNQYGWQSAI